MARKCKECKRQAIFGLPDVRGRYCRDHKKPEMIDLVNIKCNVDGCSSQATYNFPGGKGIRCVRHKTEEMIDVKHKTCASEGCDKRARCCSDEDKLKYCVAHKKDGMKDCESSYCANEGCNVIKPIFGYITGKGIYCKKHKKDDMIDVKHSRCQFPKCNSRPSYGSEMMKPLLCVKHKTDVMIDVISKRCETLNCLIQASFNFKGLKAIYCSEHALSGMINIKNQICIEKDCGKTARFGKKGSKKMTHCIDHKMDDLVDLYKRTCELCSTRSSYGKPGQQPSRCCSHRLAGMIKRPDSKCLECNKKAIYGKSLEALHCEVHKCTDDNNLLEEKCSSCGLTMILSFDKKCEYCDPDKFKLYKTHKQNELFKYLDLKGLCGKYTDKTIDAGACGKERPDRVFETDAFILVIECDEKQHKHINKECETARMINIGQALGGLPVYFIRFNPDSYKPYKKGMKQEPILSRYELLADLVKSILNGSTILPISFVSALYLYYDEWESLLKANWNTLQAI